MVTFRQNSLTVLITTLEEVYLTGTFSHLVCSLILSENKCGEYKGLQEIVLLEKLQASYNLGPIQTFNHVINRVHAFRREGPQ